MDKFNVIDQTGSLDDLENDFVAWSSLPYAFRRHADDDCIRKNGMTNQQYYEKTKAQLLNYGKDEYIGESSTPPQLDEDYQNSFFRRSRYSFDSCIFALPNSLSI